MRILAVTSRKIKTYFFTILNIFFTKLLNYKLVTEYNII